MPAITRTDQKLPELIVYVAARAHDDLSMGSMKLNKVLFHAETRAYLRLGAPISGHPYMKRELGPAPKDLRPMRAYLVRNDAIKVLSEDVGAPTARDRIVALRAPDTTLFSPEELAIVDEVIEELRPLTGTAVSDDSHKLPGWRAAGMNKEIPYATAFVSVAGTAEEHRHARQLAQSMRGK